MAFGGGGGFGGFGSTNNQSTFGSGGGFGSTNTNTGFGATANTTSPFGQQKTTSIFGGSGNTTSSPFGGGGGFGANTSTTPAFGSGTFGAKPATNLFGGSGTSGSTFGGFGTTSNTTAPAFGAANTGNSLFGQTKPAFGASTGTGTGTTGLFGGGSTGSAFGTNTSGGFGASTTTPFGAGNQAQQQVNNGTAAVPFSAFQEKDASGQQQFQTITFQQPYTNFSLEELRLVDYNQGRRYGNQNGQAGAFGQSTGFGGFGSTTNTTTGFGANTAANTGGSIFGSNNAATTTPFGQTNTTTPFGSNTNTTGGGLFGQNKPATNLFGGSTATTQANTGGGLFGNANTNTGGGFGTGATTGGFGSSTTGGSLFGGQNQTQNKPAFGGFGTATNTTTTTNPFGGGSTGGFGSNTASGGGLFGQQNQASAAPAFGATQPTANATGSIFGGGAATNTGSNLFGQSQPAQAQPQANGGLFGGFGNNQANQAKPSLFGGASTTNTTGTNSLFGGQNNQTQQTGGLFGGQQPQTQNTGLFGNKPAAPANSSLFGNTATTGNNTGLFGGLGAANNNNQGSSLFGGQNQQKPGLFGSSTTNTNTGLFGGQAQNNNASTLGGSLFSNQTQQSQQPVNNNSMFGSSLLQTTMQTNPYGNDALFAGLNTPTASPGPLATPLSSSQKPRKSAILPQHKLNPSASTRLLTPQNKRAGGYGFSYSTYGTPNSASSNSSPSFSSSLFGSSSLTRSLGKSLSTSNLRNSYTPEASILAPGAFSTNGRSFGTGSLKKLNINRNVNNRPSSSSLFDVPPSDKKRVSFASAGSNGADNGLTNGADRSTPTGSELVVRKDPEDVSPDEGPSSRNGDSTDKQPEMSQVDGTALTPVPENTATAPSSRRKRDSSAVDPTPGQYYSTPSMDALRKMSRSELSRVQDFVVGRQQIGQIQFNPGHAVDLTGVELDKLFGDIVQLNMRNATVYGETTTVPKPAQGSGLNVPSRITLGNSWPRNKGGKKDQKHIERLRHIKGTNFERFDASTGEWIFTVPHFSSYGLNYEGEEYSDEDSALSILPDTPSQLRSSQMSGTPQDDSPVSPTQSSPDDTFDFKKGRQSRASVPGGYGNEVPFEEDEQDNMDTASNESFLGERSVGSLDGQEDIDYSEQSESESVEDQDMAGPVSAPAHTTEPPAATSNMPKSILKNSHMLLTGMGTPSKVPVVFDDDWANQLQRTISPRKQDRHALRESQGNVLREQSGNIANLGRSTNAQSIFTRMGLMDSLFGEVDNHKESMGKRVGNGIEYPYPKRPKTSDDLNELSADDRDFHACNKPQFGESGTLVYASKGGRSLEGDVYPTAQQPIADPNKDIRFTKLPTFPDAVPETLRTQKTRTNVCIKDGVPYAKLTTDNPLDFADLAKSVGLDTPAGVHEQQAWQLLSLLFDGFDEVPSDTTPELFAQHNSRHRKDRLADFWETLVYQDAENHAQESATAEEKAIAYLSGHNIPDACHSLLAGLDLRLATMVSQIGGDLTLRADVAAQIEEWGRLDVLAEMQDSVRALYELISGNCGLSEGKQHDGRENKADTFSIAERFGLDWRRAFGLRLWYGTLDDESIELAVAQYADALRDGKEVVKPTPWFLKQQAHMGWNDPEASNREDILWGILKLYASSRLQLPANVEDVLAPENVAGHPLNARLSFQLFQLFKSRQEDKQEPPERKVGMPTVRHSDDLQQSFMSSTASSYEKDEQTEKPLVDLGDKIAITYAASLHTPEHWTTAIFVYAHLSSPSMREHYIRSLLAQYSKTYSVNETDPIFHYLTSEMKVPSEWIHAAAALQAKTEGDNLRQTVHLIKAGELEEAHEVLCRSVGPESIISRDYEALRELLHEFEEHRTDSPEGASRSTRGRGRQQKEPIQGWGRGGQIYSNYIQLKDLTKNLSSVHMDEQLSTDIHNLLSQLQHGLEAVAQDKWEGCGLEERVALTEIAGDVADWVAKTKHSERSRVLKLPLTEDLWLHHSSELSLSYYRAVMTTSK